jgi:capsular polysaccharide transport system permease protein
MVAIRAERARLRAERQALREERLQWRRAPEGDQTGDQDGDQLRDQLGEEGEAPLAPTQEGTDPAPVAPVDPTLPEAFSGRDAQAKRVSRAQRLLLRLLVWVVLPTLASAYYYYRQASSQFESVSLITIYSAEAAPTSVGGLNALIGLGAGSSVVTDGLAVREYIFSRDMLRRLNSDEGFIAHFADPGKDWWSRLPADAGVEDAMSSYEDRVNVEVDPMSGVATLTVQAYSAEAAQRFSQAIIRYAEEMVNELSSRARADEVKFAEAELSKTEARLAAARKRLVEVQHERGEYNPEMSAQAQLSIRTALESQLATARAELAQLLAYMTPDAPQVVGAKEKVRALSGQIAGTSRKMVAKDEDGHSLNKSAVEFEAVLVEKELATAAYQAATSAVSLARASAGRQHRYLATISPPSFADESTQPNRGAGVLTVFLCSLLFMGIGSLMVAAVKEHARL